MKYTLRKSRLKDYFFTVFYNLISSRDKNADIHFLNFGYSNPGKEIELEEKQENNRYSIQLYHQLAMKADLEGKDIVEVGSGRGGGLSYLVNKFSPNSAVGIDLSPVAVKFCNNHYNHPKLSFREANAEKLPFEDNSCDVIINVESSHRYTNMLSFLREAGRVLRPGGKLLLTDFRHHHQLPELKNHFTVSGLHQQMEEIITHNVISALRSDDMRKRALVRKVMPWFLRNTGYNFAAVKGSTTFNNFVEGKILYFNYVLEKKHAGRF